jgi:hypothetical protein
VYSVTVSPVFSEGSIVLVGVFEGLGADVSKRV